MFASFFSLFLRNDLSSIFADFFFFDVEIAAGLYHPDRTRKERIKCLKNRSENVFKISKSNWLPS